MKAKAGNGKRPALFARDLAEQREFSLSLLLAVQILLTFVVSPAMIAIGGQNRWVVDAFLALMALVSVFIVENSFRRWLALFGLGLCLVGVALGPLLAGRKEGGIVVILSALLFNANVCWIVSRKVFRDGPVTLHRIRGAVVIYLSAALLFALLDCLLASFVPDAFSNLPKNADGGIETMIYFSLTTLTTVGYGDIVPLHPFARSLAMLEAVFGQFYMGILIATLIGQFVSARQGRG